MFKPVDTKVDFPALERELLKQWYERGIVDKYLHRNNRRKKKFSFLDGPITANNPMGVHHAWGRTYKDLWQRFYNMRGYKGRFQNGFDCQGLWVEVEVEKELRIRTKKDIENIVQGNKKESIAKFVELCKQRVLKYSQIQTEQSKRLGYFMDWNHSYFTMSDENNYMIWYFLKKCFEKGWIYKGKDSVPWCPRCETAISQHEMLTEDYKEMTHETVFVKLPITTKGWENTGLLIWTTTPWTVPANVAVAVNTKFDYGIWENKKNKDRVIFISKDEFGNSPMRHFKGHDRPIADYLFHDVESEEKGRYECIQEVSGKELVGLTYTAPFDFLQLVKNARDEHPDTFHKVIDGSEIVVSTDGTGLLHVAPGAGKEDFDLGKKAKLALISPIDDSAAYVNNMNDFTGKNAKKHPEIIIDYLRHAENGKYLLKTMHFTHRYPACWRCKTELVWKVTEEWYIAMDKPEQGTKGSKNSLREQMINTAKMIEWHPDFGLDRELDWLKNMHDWLISKKNRYWGLALPIFECKECGNFEVIGSKEELKDRAVKGWNEFAGHSPHKPYIDEVRIKCSECGEIVSRIDDVGNVWLDAGIVPYSTFIDPKTGQLSYTTDKRYWQEWFPADFITESFPGQFKNWFYSLIAMSTCLEKRNPFKKVLGYASVLAEDGRPMHKSWGNSIDFNEGADKIGVDVMRWMYVNNDPEQNLLFGFKRADETRRRFHLILWNVYNFFVTYANIDRWAISDKAGVASFKKNVLDVWVESRLHQTVKTVTEDLEALKPQKAAQSIEEFVNDLSLWYIRRSRDRVGPAADDKDDKVIFYTITYDILVTLSKLLAPFTPFVADHIYKNLTNEESVHLTDWPVANESVIDENLVHEMERIRTGIIEQTLAIRKTHGLKVRQPIKTLGFYGKPTEKNFYGRFEQLIKDELNIKEIVYLQYKDRPHNAGIIDVTEESRSFRDGNKRKTTYFVDLYITPELKAEGDARDIIRRVQEERKKLGTTLSERVNVTLPEWPEAFTNYIKQQALVNELHKGNEFRVEIL